ncbi:MAG: ankyrin repeat domain-containing protein [Bryobacteraceae bacterium]|nr:ankyrin repeat domain-containing protein [Bryobacteraceae bacterium]
MKLRVVAASLLAGLFLQAQIPDMKPPTPLFGAVLRNNTDGVKQLLAEGADPNEGAFFGFPAIFFALGNGNTAMARAMLERGANVSATDRHGSTPLMWAAGADVPDFALVDDLLKRGADPNTQNKLGETALTWAVRRGDAAMIERLKAAGASDAAAVKRSVESAVALLQKSGPQFVKVSGCVSCHHQSLPQMAYSAARERAFHVDAAISDQQVKAVMAMVKPIREGLEKGTVNLPNPPITLSYALLGLAAEGYPADANTDAMVAAISRTQSADGGFDVMALRPPLEYSRFSAAALSIRALQLYGKNSEDRIRRAVEWLRSAAPVTQEDRSMKVLGLAWGKADAADVAKAARELLAAQRPDGGWAQLPGMESDSYATGQAMVALYEAKAVQPEERPYRMGVAFLLRTQMADGSWLVKTRSSPVQPLKDSGFPHGRDQWISAAGTSWAAMALSLSQPSAAGAMVSRVF